MLYHIPNGGKRSKAEAGRFKAMGVKPGVPDIHLPVPRGPYHSLYIELKAPKGRVSENQADWLADLNRYGNKAVVCYGWEQAALLASLQEGENAAEVPEADIQAGVWRKGARIMRYYKNSVKVFKQGKPIADVVDVKLPSIKIISK